MAVALVVREWQAVEGLSEADQLYLQRLVLRGSEKPGGLNRPVFAFRNGALYAQNYVGIVETPSGTVIEILPKVDLGDSATRTTLLSMLRDWRGLGEARIETAAIRAIRRFNMLEAFVRLFLESVVLLTRRGLARAYRPKEENLTCLRGRILFPRHIRENLVDRSRFYVGYEEFTVDRPANRLIHRTLLRLAQVVRQPENRQRIHQLRIAFSGVPASTNIQHDWTRYRLDRSMRHYEPVMAWVELFLQQRGLATFSGQHLSRALLFPMEEVFEDFVTSAFRKHQRAFSVGSQGPSLPFLEDPAGQPMLRLKPDITLSKGDKVQFVLDTKWKHIDPFAANHGVSSADAYQLYAYGKRYGCQRVALLYPKTSTFHGSVRFRFETGGLELVCFPIDVAEPEGAVGEVIQLLVG